MKYLCLICAEKVMEQMPPADAEKHFEEYREFTDSIRRSGHLIGCNRLLPPDAASTVRVRNGRVSVTAAHATARDHPRSGRGIQHQSAELRGQFARILCRRNDDRGRRWNGTRFWPRRMA